MLINVYLNYSCLIYVIYVCLRTVVSNIYYVVSLLCFSLSCVPYVANFSGLSVFDYPFVLCTLCCQFLSIVRFWLPLRLVYPMLPVSLDCPFLITLSSCVPYVASFSGLSVFDYPFVLCTLCCQFLWIVHLWLPLRYSLTFIYQNISPNLLGMLISWTIIT